MTDNQKRIATVFDEWAKRYAENPEDFSEILDDDGSPVTGYGERCALYYEQLYRELEVEGALPG